MFFLRFLTHITAVVLRVFLRSLKEILVLRYRLSPSVRHTQSDASAAISRIRNPLSFTFTEAYAALA